MAVYGVDDLQREMMYLMGIASEIENDFCFGSGRENESRLMYDVCGEEVFWNEMASGNENELVDEEVFCDTIKELTKLNDAELRDSNSLTWILTLKSIFAFSSPVFSLQISTSTLNETCSSSVVISILTSTSTSTSPFSSQVFDPPPKRPIAFSLSSTSV